MHKKYPLNVAHWGAYYVETDKVSNKVIAMHPYDGDKAPSPIGQNFIDTLQSNTRIKQPMIRKSWLEKGYGADTHKRGREPFIAVSWEKATQIVADELTRIIQSHGNNAIYAGSYGWASAGRFHHAQSQLKRFLNCIGGFTSSKDTYSFAAAEVIMPHIMGNLYQLIVNTTSWKNISEHTELFVSFGGMRVTNGQINNGGLLQHTQEYNMEEAYKKGVKFINVSPLQSDVLQSIHATWYAIRPNTDCALLLAIAYILYTENLYDKNFVAQYTIGFEKVIPYLLGEGEDGLVKDATWAASICDLSVAQITDLAFNMAKKRTMISVAWSLTRQEYGEYSIWASILVACMVGQIGLNGGGIGFGYSATNSVGHDYKKIKVAALAQGHNKVTDFIPVARISDMLLHPGQQFSYDGNNYTYPHIKLIYWAGGNPFHHHQDLSRLLQAWQKPDTIIAHEWCWNAHAKHADIVLPCTTTLERNDIVGAARDSFIAYSEAAVKPYAEARNDYDILHHIAQKMGVGAQFSEHKNEQEWLQYLYTQTANNIKEQHDIDLPSFDDFKNTNIIDIGPDSTQTSSVFLQGFRSNPKKYPLQTTSSRIQLYVDDMHNWPANNITAFPAWHTPKEWLGAKELTKTYPLQLISHQPHDKLHSQLDHGTYCQSQKIKHLPAMRIHPHDAKKYQIIEQDIVRIYNNRGAFLACATISNSIKCAVIAVPTGAWFDPLYLKDGTILCKNGNPNMVTPDKPTSNIAQGPSAFSCLVNIEKFNEPLPNITAYDAPIIL